MLRLFAWHGWAPVLLAVVCAGSDAPPSVCGTVRDGDGKPLAGVTIRVTGDPSPSPIVMQTSSDGKGEYCFARIPPGKYHIAAEMNGFAVSGGDRAIEVSEFSAALAIDFTLRPASSEQPARPPLKFQAAGVRGLIDPGGYSAPADAAAASGLIRGIADIRRAQNGYSRYDAKDWPCGLEPELKQSLATHPEGAEANRRMGEFYVAHNQIAAAIPFLQRAHEIDHSDHIAARDLAVAWMKGGQFGSARELLATEAEKLHTAEAHRLLARADEGSGMFSEASEQYRLATKEDPSEENLFGVGYELILAGLPSAAGRAFQAGLKQHPQSVSLLIGSGATDFLQGHATEGIEFFLRASDLAPSDPRPYSFLAKAIGVTGGEDARVQNAFKRFLQLAPNDPQAPYFYALSLLHGQAASGNSDTASIQALLKRAIALDPGLANAHMELGAVYEHGGDYEGAAREYEKTLQLVPGLIVAHYRLAGVYRHIGRSDLAAQHMQVFQQTREPSQAKDSTTDIEQFISAFERTDTRTVEETQCPVSAH